MGRPHDTADPGSLDLVARRSFRVAAAAGTVHALFSLYWSFGGDRLLDTLGARIVDAFEGLRWVLVPVALLKLAAAWLPVELHRRGWPRARLWRPACWTGAAVLVAWGGMNTAVGQLVLAGVIDPDGGYDRPGMIGHAWLWDPLFLVWGLALALGLWRSRGRPRTAARRDWHPSHRRRRQRRQVTTSPGDVPVTPSARAPGSCPRPAPRCRRSAR